MSNPFRRSGLIASRRGARLPSLRMKSWWFAVRLRPWCTSLQDRRSALALELVSVEAAATVAAATTAAAVMAAGVDTEAIIA